MSFIYYSLRIAGRPRESALSKTFSKHCDTFAYSPSQSIEQAIAAGTTVVVDRYIYSGCVYSAAKNNPSLDLSWARNPEVGLPRPDICLFLELTAAQAAERGGWGEERYEKKELQDRVRELFGAMRKSQDGEDFLTIDAGRAMADVEASIWAAVSAVIARVDESGLRLRRVTNV